MPLHILSPSTQVMNGLAITCHSLAISTTFFRLVHRVHIRRLWWDDFWAAVSLTTDATLFITYLVGLWVNTTSSAIPNWLTLLSYNSTLWSARLTVAVTIVRIVPQGRLVRRIAKGVSIVFGLFWLSIIIQNVVSCAQTGTAGFPFCTSVAEPFLFTGIQELVTNFLADIWLLFAPAYILWQMKLQRPHHTLIFAIFLCGIFTTLTSIIHVVFTVLRSLPWMILTGHIELAVAVIVSNLLVVVTYIYRVFRNMNSESRANRNVAPRPRPTTAGQQTESSSNSPSNPDQSFTGEQSTSFRTQVTDN